MAQHVPNLGCQNPPTGSCASSRSAANPSYSLEHYTHMPLFFPAKAQGRRWNIAVLTGIQTQTEKHISGQMQTENEGLFVVLCEMSLRGLKICRVGDFLRTRPFLPRPKGKIKAGPGAQRCYENDRTTQILRRCRMAQQRKTFCSSRLTSFGRTV